ncbi:MAG: glycosyltransferase [bacterium]|nr:glycosyltransferase [bacterium]
MPKWGAGTACRKKYRSELLRQTDAYAGWIAEEEDKEISGRQVMGGPLITVVPYFKKNRWKQSYSNLEYLREDLDILDFAHMSGEFIVYINGDGMLEEDAISTFSKLLNHDLIYCDEDCILRGSNTRLTPFFKPDASPDTLQSFFYFGNIFAVRRSLAVEIAVMRSGEDSSRLYDFAMKYMKVADRTAHISKVLYHKMIDDISESITYGIEINHDKKLEMPKSTPLVSMIILSKDHPDILRMCVKSIEIKSKYNRKEIVIVDNGSAPDVRQELEQFAQDGGYTYLYHPMDFNYSVLCNIGAETAHGEYLLFLNDDIEAADEMFIEKMLYYACQPHIGAVGAKLLYPDSDIIQHVGITSLVCGPSHKLATFSDQQDYYFGRNRLDYNVLAVTGACMMVSREKYFQVGGFSDKMGVSYNDVDLCVSLYEAGLYNVICNQTFLYHHESLSRGTDLVSDDKYRRLIHERNILYSRHEWLKAGDPFYNQNLSQDTLEYIPNVPCSYSAFGYYNPVKTVQLTDLQPCSQAQMVIEKTELIRGYDGEEDDYYRIEGWSLHMKRDNALLHRSLLLIPTQGETLKIELSSRYRKDVSEVFPKAKNSELAGFVCRIRKKYLQSGMAYQTAILAESQVTSAKYMILGEQYEPTGK